MSQGRKTCQMESVLLEINGHMTSVGEEISCVLEKHTSSDVCHVRVFVLERLSAAAQFICSLFQREMERLAADVLALCTEEIPAGHQECSSSLVQEEARPPQIKERLEEPDIEDRGTSQQPASDDQLLSPHCSGSDTEGKSEGDDRWESESDNREMEPLSSASAEHMKTQDDVEDCGTDQLLSSDCADAEDAGEDWAETREDFLHVLVCKEDVTSEEKRSSNLVQEEPQIEEEQEELLQRLGEAGGSTLTLLAVKSEDDDENRETEPVAGTSNEHMKTQAYIEYWVRSQPTGDDQLLSSHCSESDTEESDDSDTEDSDDEWQETRKSQKTQNVGGRRKMSQDLKSSGHTAKERFCCTECGKMFNYKGNLKTHMRIHTGENRKLSQYLKSSRQTHSMRSRTEKERFCCTECGKMFNFKGNLKTHMRTHTGEKPFSCTVCGTGFAQTSSLKTHMRIHTGEKPFACSVCGKGFVDGSSLKIHMRTHTGEKPFSCTVCGKRCSEKSSLKTHMMTHTGRKPFLCTICGKGCVSRGDLETHMRTHTGEKPFSCTLCGTGFTQTGSLNVHMRTHTGEKPFSCTLCGTGFTQASSLKTHMQTHTEEKPLV